MTAMVEERDRAVLPDAVREACRACLATAERPVRLVVCTARVGEADEVMRRLVTELAALSPAVQLELLDRDDDRPLLERYGVELTPAVVLMTGGVEIGDTGIRFYGRPTTALALALADDVAAVSRGETHLSLAARRWLEELRRPVHVQVFVRGDGLDDRAAVALVHQLALASGFVWADAVVAPAFPDLARQFAAAELPSVVVDGAIRLPGPITEAALLGAVQAAVGASTQPPVDGLVRAGAGVA